MNYADPKQGLAPGCCSAVSPCDHQRKDPHTICATCQCAAGQITRAEWEALMERERQLQQPSEVAAVLRQAADHAGASAGTYRRLAEMIEKPGFVAGAAPVDIAKALRDAYGRGYAHCGRQAGEEPQGLNAYNDERDAWIAQYMARLPSVDPADVEALRKKLAEAWQENEELRKQISDIYAAQNG